MKQGAYLVRQVRAAEEAAMTIMPEGELMQAAARGLLEQCLLALRERGGVLETRVLALIGTGNNGGDTLWAATGLLNKGAIVTAVSMGGQMHAAGSAAFVAAGGTVVLATDANPQEFLTGVALVLDGIVGIGGSGALREPAVTWSRAIALADAWVIAIDVPSGVDADTGAVADPQRAVTADATVTFGCLKPGLLVEPGKSMAGSIAVVDIGLGDYLQTPDVQVMGLADAAAWVSPPIGPDYKYSRGVASIAAGSSQYRGAAFLSTSAARAGTAGMVRLLDREDGVAPAVVDHFWDVVLADQVADPKVTAWGVGPGLGTDEAAVNLLCQVLQEPCPVVIDADALRLMADPTARPRQVLGQRVSDGLVTIMTPHEGEFRGLGYSSHMLSTNRIDAARQAAADLGVIMVLKGPGTIITGPWGVTYVDTQGRPELGTAGSGDVLTGFMTALLARAHVAGVLRHDGASQNPLTIDIATQVAAAGVAIHGVAGRLAARDGQPVTGQDLALALPAAVAFVREQ